MGGSKQNFEFMSGPFEFAVLTQVADSTTLDDSNGGGDSVKKSIGLWMHKNAAADGWNEMEWTDE
jgi:hypothetical protein